MDLKTQEILQRFQSHYKIKKLLTSLCYVFIVGGILVYIFYGFSENKNIKLVNDYKQNQQKFKTEKIMTNPRIKLQYGDKQLYNIRAKKAFHEDEKEVLLFDVFAEGDLGKITAGELKISESGDRLVFTKNPILILNEVKK